MKKKIAIIILIIGVLSLGFGAWVLIKNIQEDQKKQEELRTSIVNEYATFKGKMETFSTERTNIYESLNGINYLTDINTKYASLISDFQKYEGTLKEIDDSSNILKKNCNNKSFNDKDVNNKLEAFIINYEQAFNYFIQDVAKLNERIKEYNDWVTTQGTGKQLEEYVPQYKDYVDVNKDGKFNGVEKDS